MYSSPDADTGSGKDYRQQRMDQRSDNSDSCCDCPVLDAVTLGMASSVVVAVVLLAVADTGNNSRCNLALPSDWLRPAVVAGSTIA